LKKEETCKAEATEELRDKKMYTKSDNWSELPDVLLVEKAQKADETERNAAMEALQARHQAKLLRYANSQLCRMGVSHETAQWLAEDATQETWLAVSTKLKTNTVQRDFQSVLRGIAHNKCFDIADKYRDEWHIENDVPLSEDIEENNLEREEHDIASQLLFITSKLAPCPRVVWILKVILEYETSVVARLLGKKEQTIYSALNKAKESNGYVRYFYCLLLWLSSCPHRHNPRYALEA